MNKFLSAVKLFFKYSDTAGQPVNNALYSISFFLLLMYSLMKIALYDYFKLIEPAFILVGLYLFFKTGKLERNTLPVYLLFYSIFVVFLVWAATKISPNELITSGLSLEHLARHFVFIIGAYLLAGSTKKINVYFIFSMAGLLIIPWTQGDGWVELVSGWNGVRIDFNIQNAQHLGVIFSVAFLGIAILFNRFFYSFFLKVIGLFLLLFTGFVVLSSQTRSAVIGLAIVFFLLLFFLVFYYSKSKLLNKINKIYLLSLVVVIGVLATTINNFQLFSKSYERIEKELYVMDSLVKGDLSDIPYSSVGARLHSWHAGFEFFLERPIVGWGSDGGAIVNRNASKLQGTVADSWGHMHSSYMETMVRYGLLGVSIYIMLFIWFFIKLYVAWRNKIIPNDYYLFFICFFVFWFFVNFFESYMYYWTGVYVFNLVMASAVSYIWKDMRSNQIKRSDDNNGV